MHIDAPVNFFIRHAPAARIKAFFASTAFVTSNVSDFCKQGSRIGFLFFHWNQLTNLEKLYWQLALVSISSADSTSDNTTHLWTVDDPWPTIVHPIIPWFKDKHQEPTVNVSNWNLDILSPLSQVPNHLVAVQNEAPRLVPQWTTDLISAENEPERPSE